LRNYQELLKASNKAQLEKLLENEHKKGFENTDIFYATGRIQDELGELKEALYKGDMAEVRREAADIANFASMIILRCDKEFEFERID